ncbi:MAG: hypothetical protein WBP44_00430 [Gammaproteobacteria bacterium]|jgi:RNA-directed DNA polymerase
MDWVRILAYISGTVDQVYRVAVDVDLSKFFDRVNHDILMNRLSRFIPDKGLLKLIGRYLRAGVLIVGKLCPTPEGVPQGGAVITFIGERRVG